MVLILMALLRISKACNLLTLYSDASIILTYDSYDLTLVT